MPGAMRRQRQAFDIWPGFVDALSALLIIIIFLLMVLPWRSFSWARSYRAATRRLND